MQLMTNKIIYVIISIVIALLIATIIDVILYKGLKYFEKDRSILIFSYIRLIIAGIMMCMTYHYPFVLIGITAGVMIERIAYVTWILYCQKIEKRCLN